MGDINNNSLAKNYWALFLMASIYMVGELGHFLLGTVSRAMAQDIHFGDKGCLKPTLESLKGVSSDICTDVEEEQSCLTVTTEVFDPFQNGTLLVHACTWDYTGLGLAYHILAGPAFVAVFTIAGLGWGYFADKFNRVRFLSVAALIFSLAIMGTSFATKYWHVLLFRMALALGESGCSPLASGIIADMFPKSRRGLAMSLFNWGIYIGYGFSYTVGTYVTDANIFDKGWRPSYVISGIPGIILGLLFLFTATDPPRTKTDESSNAVTAAVADTDEAQPSSPTPSHTELASFELEDKLGHDHEHMNRNTEANTSKTDLIIESVGSRFTITFKDSKPGGGGSSSSSCSTSSGDMDTRWDRFVQGVNIGWNILKNPATIFLLLGACVRHAAGFCWGYNSALYFKTYYPDYDVSLWLTGISIGAGATGTLIGGYLSDRLVNKLGISARALVLACSQLLASPFAFALFFLEPPYALFSLLAGYICAEMWFGVMFAILVELVPTDIRSKAVAVVLFCINNVGGNTPVIVDPIAHATSYRTAILILYPGALISSSILFFICWGILRSQRTKK